MGAGCTRVLAVLIVLAAASAAVFAEPPQRICSVSLAGDELLALLVPPERVVCVSAFADDPSMSNAAGHFADRVPRLTARIEPVLAARPDLVVAAPWNRGSFLDLLESSGVPSLVLEPVVTFDDIRAELVRMGEAVGAIARARRVASDLDRRLERLAQRLEAIERRPRVLSFSHMIVSGDATTVDTLIERAGGVNAAEELGIDGHRKVAMERLVALDPDVLLLGFDTKRSVDELIAAYPHLENLRAVRTGRVVVLPPRQMTTVSPYLVEGVEALARALHPGIFDEPLAPGDGS